MPPLSSGQRVSIYEMGAGFVGTGTVIGRRPDGYRVAIDVRFGGGSLTVPRIELEPLPTDPSEVVH